MKQFSIRATNPNDFAYEYYLTGLTPGKTKIVTEDELKNTMLQDLIIRNALTVQPYLEKDLKPEPIKKQYTKSSTQLKKIVSKTEVE